MIWVLRPGFQVFLEAPLFSLVSWSFPVYAGVLQDFGLGNFIALRLLLSGYPDGFGNWRTRKFTFGFLALAF
jgi:hypothetical protein